MLLEHKRDGNMKKLIATLLTTLALIAQAEVIAIKSPYNAQHTGHTALYKIMENANQSQTQYNFVLELKPGGNGIVALKDMGRTPATALTLINAAYVQNIIDNKLRDEDYIPVAALGDACWIVVGNLGNEKQGIKSLAPVSVPLVYGGVGFGTASHLLSIEISDQINQPVRYVSFKSAAEANILLTGENGVHIGLMSHAEFINLKTKNSKLQRLAVHCDYKLSSAPGVLTLKEQGISSPTVFNTILASVDMPKAKLQEITKVLNNSMVAVGKEKILELSDFIPPNFKNQSVEDYHNEKLRVMRRALIKHRDAIEAAR
jgi:tripartite-type tricarboxylate transporter receptor subunit TctC